MTTPAMTGVLVRLTTLDLEKDLEEWARWMQDSGYQRTLDVGPSSLFTPAAIRAWMEKEIGKDLCMFSIREITEDRLVGFIDLSGFDWPARSCWVGIGIGDPRDRGRGFGTEAMRLAARYAFEQLNLNRINLNVFEFNPGAVRSYEKAGFVHEGRERAVLNRYGRRWDMLFMGLLRQDWEQQRT